MISNTSRSEDGARKVASNFVVCERATTRGGVDVREEVSLLL